MAIARRPLVSLALAVVLLAVALAGASAQGAPAGWLRTTRDTGLWSGPAEPAERFTTLPAGSYVLPQSDAGDQARQFVYYPGDGQSRQPGSAWISTSDIDSSAAPPWVTSSEVDLPGPVIATSGLRRQAYLTPPDVSAPEVAVVDDETGLVLYGRSAHAREAPASTTKIATAIVALARVDSLDQVVPITVDGWAMATADGSSVMGLAPGQRISLRTLLYGLLLPSGNDAAEQLARTLTESRPQFVAAMNDIVVSAGLQDTHFSNPSGLDAVGHYSSAYDLAQLARIAMRDERFASVVASPVYRGDGFRLEGHNPLLGVYPGADGVKTGTTDAAGRAIVASAVRDGHRVYVVVLHSDDLLGDCTALFDWAWHSFTW